MRGAGLVVDRNILAPEFAAAEPRLRRFDPGLVDHIRNETRLTISVLAS
jgi:hypothetical protein